MSHPSHLDSSYNSRRLPLQLQQHTATPPPPYVRSNNHDQTETYASGNNSIDSNVVMVLSVLLCALICSLGLNTIIRCAFKCSDWMSTEQTNGRNAQNSARRVNTGVKKKALKTFPIITYSCGINLPGIHSDCVICLSEFGPGDRLRLLPKCNHGFHARCIDKWLSSHSSCPTCRQCLLQACQKIVGGGGGDEVRASEAGEMIQVMVVPIQVAMPPLEAEGPVREVRGVGQSVGLVS